MIKINYEIQVPGGLDTVPEVSAEDSAFQAEMFNWSLENGVVDYDFKRVSPTRRTFSYTWIDQAAVTAFEVQFADRYPAYYERFIAGIESADGICTRIVSEV